MKVTVDITEQMNILLGSHFGLSEEECLNLIMGQLAYEIPTLRVGQPEVYIIEYLDNGEWKYAGAQPASRFNGFTQKQIIDFMRTGYAYLNSTLRYTSYTGAASPVDVTPIGV